jgi:hypothetical protein
MSTHCGKCFGQGHSEEMCDRRHFEKPTIKPLNANIDKVIDLVLAEAYDRAQSLGMSGSWSDGGASEIRSQVDYYRYGMSGVMPPDWQKFADQVSAMSDPEYETYKRLKAKFGDR